MIIKILRFVAIIIFDILDKYLHQKRIKMFFKSQNTNLNFCIDVGAHNGFYSDLILKINNRAKIYLFEPQKKYYVHLKKKYKNSKNIKIYKKALSNKNTVRTLFINKHDLTSTLAKNINHNLYFRFKAFLFNTNIEGMVQTKAKINTIRLENKLKKNNQIIDLIKIDTEGHEFEVLKGIGKKLKLVKYLIVEFHSKKTYLNYSPDKIHKFLVNQGFKLEKTFHFPLSTFEDRVYKNSID